MMAILRQIKQSYFHLNDVDFKSKTSLASCIQTSYSFFHFFIYFFFLHSIGCNESIINWSLLFNTVFFPSRFTALLSHVILNECILLQHVLVIHKNDALTALSGCYMAGSMCNCCRLSTHSVHTTQLHISLRKNNCNSSSSYTVYGKWWTEVVYLQHYPVVTGLVPHGTAAVSVHVLCPPYNYAPVYKKKSQLLLLPSVESDEPKWCAYTALFGCYGAGSTSNCCSLSVSVLRAPYNHAPVYTLVFHNSSSYLSVKSDRAWSLQAVLLHALEVV